MTAATITSTERETSWNGTGNLMLTYCARLPRSHRLAVCACVFVYCRRCVCEYIACERQCEFVPTAIVSGVLTQHRIQKNQLIGVVHAVSILNIVRCDVWFQYKFHLRYSGHDESQNNQIFVVRSAVFSCFENKLLSFLVCISEFSVQRKENEKIIKK